MSHNHSSLPKLDHTNFYSCVERGMTLIRLREKQAIDENLDWNINTDSCRWAIEQSIINRAERETMMTAVVRYVEGIEARIWGV